MPHGRKTPLPEERFPAGRFYPSPAVYKQQSGVPESDISPRERGRGLQRCAESQRHQHGEHGGTEGHGGTERRRGDERSKLALSCLCRVVPSQGRPVSSSPCRPVAPLLRAPPCLRVEVL